MLAFGLTLVVSVAATPPLVPAHAGDKLASTYEDAACDPADGGECADEVLIDLMPPRGEAPDVVRIVEGRSGSVDVHMQLVIRFDYGSIVPWARSRDGAHTFVAGPDGLELRTPAATRGEGLTTVADVSRKVAEIVGLQGTAPHRKVRITVRGRSVTVELCESCTETVLAELGARDETAPA